VRRSGDVVVTAALRGGKAEGGWDGRDGSALAASAQSRNTSNACTRRLRRRSERLLRRTHVEATCPWRCPLPAGGGEVDKAMPAHPAYWLNFSILLTVSVAFFLGKVLVRH
jgi:hypothetical protein